MKLYTEEQVRKAYNEGCWNGFNEVAGKEDEVINSLSPIELPSDEEVSQLNPFRLGGGNYNGSAAYQWQKGAKWMRYKIINQKK